MESIPLCESVEVIEVRQMKKKHFDQVQMLKIVWSEEMPEHEVLGIVSTDQNDWILFKVGSAVRKLWIEDYMSIALGIEQQAAGEEWFKVKRQIMNETPQVFTT